MRVGLVVSGAILAAAVALFALPAAAGESQEVPAVYAHAVEWLVAHQNENGSFGQVPDQPPGEVGVTALVIKGLCDAPEPSRARLRPAAARAVTWLLSFQKKNGAFAMEGGHLATYRTAMSIMALVAFDRAAYRGQIERARDFLIGTQFDESHGVARKNPHYGGWGYDHSGKKPDADLSNVHMALQALHEAGVPPDSPVFKRALEFVSRCQNDSESNPGIVGLRPKDDGGFIYDPGLNRNKSRTTDHKDGTHSVDSYASMTYAGLLSLCCASVGQDDPRVKAAWRWITSHYTLDENYGLGTRENPAGGQQGLYYYYLVFAKALDAAGKREIDTAAGARAWGPDLLAALAARQKPGGFFSNDKSPRWWEKDPVLATAYAVAAMDLALRNLPAKGAKKTPSSGHR